MAAGAQAVALVEIAIYAGRECCGYLVQQGAEEWLARNDDDAVIGCYSTRKAALDAILAAARQR